MYTKEELIEIAEGMRVATRRCYPILRDAGQGCHAFIEFNGLMSKFVDICERAAKQGVSFPEANGHLGGSLPVEGHDIDYLAEKFECIFGPTLAANPELARRFIRKVFGETVG